MKKPWRFTPKQVRRQQNHYERWKRAYQFYCRSDFRKMQMRNRQQLRLELIGWVDEATYLNSIRDRTNWNFW